MIPGNELSRVRKATFDHWKGGSSNAYARTPSVQRRVSQARVFPCAVHRPEAKESGTAKVFLKAIDITQGNGGGIDLAPDSHRERLTGKLTDRAGAGPAGENSLPDFRD